MSTFTNCTVTGAEIAFLVQKGSNSLLEDCRAIDSKLGFVEFDNDEQLKILTRGLSKYQGELKELEDSVTALQEKTKPEIERVVKASSLVAALGIAANSAQVIDFLVSHVSKALNL